MKGSLIISILLILAACSSLKQPIQPQAKLDADTFYNQALKLESQKNTEASNQSYTLALGMYRSFADIKGQVSCLCGLARLELANGNKAVFMERKASIEQLIKETDPTLETFPLLLQIYLAQQDKDYQTIARLAVAKPDYPLSDRLQLASLKLQAESYLGTATAAQAKELHKLADKYRKNIKYKAGNTELLSTAWYSLAYYNFVIKDYGSAIKYLTDSASWDYKYGNFSALGHCFWLRAQIEIAGSDNAGALSSLRKAEGIFNEFNDGESLQRVQALIYQVKGEK